MFYKIASTQIILRSLSPNLVEVKLSQKPPITQSVLCLRMQGRSCPTLSPCFLKLFNTLEVSYQLLCLSLKGIIYYFFKFDVEWYGCPIEVKCSIQQRCLIQERLMVDRDMSLGKVGKEKTYFDLLALFSI